MIARRMITRNAVFKSVPVNFPCTIASVVLRVWDSERWAIPFDTHFAERVRKHLYRLRALGLVESQVHNFQGSAGRPLSYWSRT